jgi:hypothetical protein
MKYKTAESVLTAIRANHARGVVAWQGPSRIDGAPIMIVFNRLTFDGGIDRRRRNSPHVGPDRRFMRGTGRKSAHASANAKTGAMVQSFIMRRDIAPHIAIKTGQDSSVCGNCPLRPVNREALKAEGKKPCYVRVWQSPRSVFAAYHNGRYLIAGVDFPARLLSQIFAGMRIRLGSYGDPYAVPSRILKSVTLHAKSITGYSHQWQRPNTGILSRFCMASVDNPADKAKAESKGFRTFRVRRDSEPLESNEIVCPASKEAGVKTNCASCGLCRGAAQAKSTAIIFH